MRRRAWAIRVALVGFMAGGGCSDPQTEAAEAPEAELVAPVVAGVADESAARPESVETAQLETSAGEQVAPSSLETEPVAEPVAAPNSPPTAAGAAPIAPRVDIFRVMQTGGWGLEIEEDLADYLPIPPRAEGQVGRFIRDGETIRVARITYPAVIFADPHESWIRERMALLPDEHERVVRRGATVIHIRAESAAAADEVVHLFEVAVGESEDEG